MRPLPVKPKWPAPVNRGLAQQWGVSRPQICQTHKSAASSRTSDVAGATTGSRWPYGRAATAAQPIETLGQMIHRRQLGSKAIQKEVDRAGWRQRDY
jgi:hypothetical protein